ncbi:MAG: hypothetical protein KFF73_13845 [Cyclobacteriaceae bacterium]|nr:hypothetical protein [Cyclobacteriaceae bacterium]
MFRLHILRLHKSLLFPVLLGLVIFSWSGCRYGQVEENLYLDNQKIRLGFDRRNGALIEMKDLVNSIDYLETDSMTDPPWEISFLQDGTISNLDPSSPFLFSFSHPDGKNLVLNWENFAGQDNKKLRVTVSVSLEKSRPLSSWKISVEGIEGDQVHQVVFPKIRGLKDQGDQGEEKLAVPFWMGQEIRDPRKHLSSIQNREKKFEWDYPGQLSMQCLYLYNEERSGFYAACNDSLAYRKSFTVSLDTLNRLTWQMNNYPPPDSTIQSYSTPYEAIIGSFEGDWITAAVLYRDWASRQQWCSEDRISPGWLDSTALWVWNRGNSDLVLNPALDLQQRLGLPVNVFWHWWHDCAYDVGFPEYFPPREGRDPFISAVSGAREKGIQAIVYMNVLQWGTSTKSWTEENASTHAVKNIDGSLRSHVYNIFTGKSLTNMCIATPFWKDKYASLARKAIQEYGLSGIYMDQACLSRMCYDNKHGHAIGGGNYWVDHFGRLTGMIRQELPEKERPVLAGEGGGESWIPYLDAFLTLQVSKERYAGPGDWETIPMFQAVYHPYAVSYGNYSSLLTPPYDERWPEEFAPEGPLKLLDESFNLQFLMEQARSFVWGMQPAIANYRSFLASERKEEIDYMIRLARVRYRGLKYLLYGKFLRSPAMEIPEKEMNISRLSIYAGRGQDNVTSFTGKYPQVYTGTWQSDDKNIAIAIASISADPFPVRFSFSAGDYDLPDTGNIYLTDVDGKGFLNSYRNGKIDVNFSLPPKGLAIVEITP